ncbi:MAG: tRNA pseudouridine(13) synthase TruD [Planctomycetaceae bacterium]
MKLKRFPDDFVVTEVCSREVTSGRYALYRLSKRSIATLEAVQILQRSWNLPPASAAHAGLKDRHAVTSQYITLKNGPRSGFEHELFTAEYLGQTDTAMTAHDIAANHFHVVLRSVSDADAERICSRAAVVAESGYPNYFDRQRFGSLGPSREFVAEKWCRRDFEQAAWLALAEHNQHDDASERHEKQILRDLWNNWPECKQQLSRSHRRSIVTYLCDHPTGFRKAFALINADLRGLYLSAFQSAVWNRMLSALITRSKGGTAEEELDDCVLIGDAELPMSGADHLERDATMPLPSVRCKGLDAATRQLVDVALQAYNMTLPEMKISFPRDRWFSKALRPCVVVPENLTATRMADDDAVGRTAVSLDFQLPRGCYATMLVKAVTGLSDC